MYDLIHRLHAEAQDVEITCSLVEEGLLTRLQRDKYCKLHKKIHEAWDIFENRGTMSAQTLLETCSKLNYGPITMH